MASRPSLGSHVAGGSVGGRTVSRTDLGSSISSTVADTLEYDDTGAVVKKNLHEQHMVRAFRAKKSANKSGRRRRQEIIGLHGFAKKAKAPIKLPFFEKSQETKELIFNALRRNVMFNEYSTAQLEQFTDAMKPKKVARGTTLISQGDPGYNFYVVNGGEFAFVKDGKVVGHAKGGDSFGELALMYDARRTVSVKATQQSEIWKIDRVTFRQILDTSTAAKEAKIKNALKKTRLFHRFSEEKLSMLADIVLLQSFQTGDAIIVKGEEGHLMYVVVSGSVQVTKSGHGNDLNDTIFGPGDYFGETAAIHNVKRTANVIAISPTQLLALDRDAFQQHLGSLVEVMDKNFSIRILQTVDELSQLSSEMFDELVEEMKEEKFKPGEQIIAQGDQGSKFYIVKLGEVRIVSERDDGSEVEVSRIGMGAYFGELALLDDKPRAASAYAVNDTTLMSLDRENFERLFGSLEALKKKARKRTSQLRNSHFTAKSTSFSTVKPSKSFRTSFAGSVARKRVPTLRIKALPKSSFQHSDSPDIDFKDLKLLTTLGTGTFGRVRLVQHGPTNETFAMKILQKQQIVECRQERNVLMEKKVLAQCNHPFILKLVRTFKDDQCLYMLLELVLGGELFSVLHNQPQKRLGEGPARFYTACVVEAFHYLHRKNIAYRDLKPENLMIDPQGYIKVVDFGFAKKVHTKTTTLCGTPEYLAPELVLQKGHNKAVDYWAVGVLVFEMLNGISPFASDAGDQTQILRNIVKLKVRYPSDFPPEAKNFVQKLLKKQPHERLGMGRRGAEDVKKHPWFSPIDWNDLYAKQIVSPWEPPLKNNKDTSNFDEYDEDDYMEFGNYEDDGSNWDKDF